jgi:hypothetical protein
MSGGLPMKIKRNSLVMLRLWVRGLRRWLFPTERDDKISINRAKGRAKRLDCHELSVVDCQPVVRGCFLSLLSMEEVHKDSIVKVFSPSVVPKNIGRVQVWFSEEPDEMLHRVFGHTYRFETGSYLRVARIYR